MSDSTVLWPISVFQPSKGRHLLSLLLIHMGDTSEVFLGVLSGQSTMERSKEKMNGHCTHVFFSSSVDETKASWKCSVVTLVPHVCRVPGPTRSLIWRERRLVSVSLVKEWIARNQHSWDVGFKSQGHCGGVSCNGGKPPGFKLKQRLFSISKRSRKKSYLLRLHSVSEPTFHRCK